MILIDYFNGGALPERIMPILYPLFMLTPPHMRRPLWARLYSMLWVLVNIWLLLPVFALFVWNHLPGRAQRSKDEIIHAVASAVASANPRARIALVGYGFGGTRVAQMAGAESRPISAFCAVRVCVCVCMWSTV